MASSPDQPLVLVADPDAEYAALMARQLEWAGYDVVTSGDAATTVALLEERRPDALVIEAKLPDATGYEIVRQLRELAENRLMPILMVSARAGKLDRDFAFRVGADDYVRKPFPYSQIVARLAEMAPAPAEPARPIAQRPRVRASQPIFARA